MPQFIKTPQSMRLTPLIIVVLFVTLFAQQSSLASGIHTFFKSNDSSNRILYSDNYNNTSWSNGKEINSNDSTSSSVTAAAFRGKMYAVWRLNDSSLIYYSSSDDGNFPDGKEINNAFTTSATPTAVAFGDKLYVFWKANNSSKRIFYASTSDGEHWSDSQTINSVDSTLDAIAAAVYNNNLYLFWRSSDSNIFYSVSSDGNTWPNGKTISSANNTSAAPSAAVFNNKLYVVWKSDGSDKTKINYSASSDGKNWPSGQNINSNASTSAAPAVAASDGNLYVVWKADDNSGSILYSASSDGKTWPNGKNINGVDSTSAAPTLVTTPRYTGSFQCGGDGYENGTCYSPDYTDSENFGVIYATGGNGYDFHLGPGEKAEFRIACTYDKMKSYDVVHNNAVNCSKDKEYSRHFKIECHNKSNSDHHDVNFKKYHCGPTQPACTGGNECQQPINPGGGM